MKHPMRWLAAGLVCLAAWSLPAGERRIFADGASDYVIVVVPEAAEPEKNAARELQRLLQEAGGVTLPIVEQFGYAAHILVGPATVTASRRLEVDMDFASFAPDEIYQHTVDGDLILAGGSPRGTLYAVYEFAERALGAEFFTSTVTPMPTRRVLALPNETRRYAPPFTRRESFREPGDPKDESRWRYAVPMRLNGWALDIPAAWGGSIKTVGHSHTFGQFIHEKDYFKEHPEWFSLGADGKRVAGHLLGQLCLTNADMRAEFVRKAADRMRPLWPTDRPIALSANDNRVHCRCDVCLASDKKLGGPTDTMIEFLNHVAEALDREFPGIQVETLAYFYSAPPPKTVKPRDNLWIRLCSIDADFSKPFDSDGNAVFREQLKGWVAAAPGRVMLWDYVANFGDAIGLFPATLLYADNIRFFRDTGAVMAFEQGTRGPLDYLRELRLWFISKLLWNPDENPEALLGRFLRGYYGPAAPALRAFLDLVHDEGRRFTGRLGIEEPNATHWFTPAAAARGYALFREAEDAVAGDDALSDRVRRARLALDWTTLDWRVREPDRPEWAGAPEVEPLLDDLGRIIDAAEPASVRDGLRMSIMRFRRALLLRPENDPLLAPLIAGRPCMDMQEFFFYNGSTYGSQRPDPAASDGFAACFDAGYDGKWGGGLFLWKPEVRRYADLAGKRRFYATMRQEGGKPGGRVLTVGVYNRVTKSHGFIRRVTAEECGTDIYAVVDLGVSPVSNDTDVYFQLSDDAGATHVWLDRLLLVEEK